MSEKDEPYTPTYNGTPVWVDTLASEFAGNHLEYDRLCTTYSGTKAPGHVWGEYFLCTRGTRCCLTESNNAYIESTMKKYFKGRNPTAMITSYGHWACGWLDVLCVQVYRKDGKYTKAFLEFAKIQGQLTEYPVLDEEDLMEREYKRGEEYLPQFIEDTLYDLGFIQVVEDEWGCDAISPEFFKHLGEAFLANDSDLCYSEFHDYPNWQTCEGDYYREQFYKYFELMLYQSLQRQRQQQPLLLTYDDNTQLI